MRRLRWDDVTSMILGSNRFFPVPHRWAGCRHAIVLHPRAHGFQSRGLDPHGHAPRWPCGPSDATRTGCSTGPSRGRSVTRGDLRTQNLGVTISAPCYACGPDRAAFKKLFQDFTHTPMKPIMRMPSIARTCIVVSKPHSASFFLFVLHDTNGVGRLLREAIFCLF